MASNRAVVYMGPRKVEVQSIDYPELVAPDGRKCNHGVIVKLVSTNICGSDLHMYRGRTSAPKGTVFGHENTGEVIEAGSDVEYIRVGDIVSVPFNIACGRCRNCKARFTNLCSNTNPAGIGGAYGFVGMGGWKGGQADYMMVPYADFNLLKFPDKDQAMEKIDSLTMLSDILPTGYHGAVQAGVGSGSTVYIAGAGPVGLCCAESSFFLGAAVVIVGDRNLERLALAKKMGCETIDITKTDDLRESINQILGVPEVDASVDCVGYEAHGLGKQSDVEAPLLNPLMEVSRVPSGIGVPGLYLPDDPGGAEEICLRSSRHGEVSGESSLEGRAQQLWPPGPVTGRQLFSNVAEQQICLRPTTVPSRAPLKNYILIYKASAGAVAPRPALRPLHPGAREKDGKSLASAFC